MLRRPFLPYDDLTISGAKPWLRRTIVLFPNGRFEFDVEYDGRPNLTESPSLHNLFMHEGENMRQARLKLQSSSVILAAILTAAAPVSASAQSFQNISPDMTLSEVSRSLNDTGFTEVGSEDAGDGLERTTYQAAANRVFSSSVIEILHSGSDVLAIRNLMTVNSRQTSSLANMREAIFQLGGASTTRFEGPNWEMSVYRGDQSERDCGTYPVTLTNRSVALDYNAAWAGNGTHCNDGSVTFIAFDPKRRSRPVTAVVTVLYDYGDGRPASTTDNHGNQIWNVERGLTSFDPGYAYVPLDTDRSVVFGIACADRLDADSEPDFVLMAKNLDTNAAFRDRVFGNLRDAGSDGKPVKMLPLAIEGTTNADKFEETLDMTGIGGTFAEGFVGGRTFSTASFAASASMIEAVGAAKQLRISLGQTGFEVPVSGSAAALDQLPCLSNAPVDISDPAPNLRTEVQPEKFERFEAYSRTAMGVSGDLTIAGRSLTFTEGQTLLIDRVGSIALGSINARLYSIALYKTRLAQEFCGTKPAFISMARHADGMLSLAFYRSDPRQASGSRRGACGIYNYYPAK